MTGLPPIFSTDRVSPRTAFLASALAYVAVTCVMARHVLASLGTAIASDPGDPVLNAAILAWNATQRPWTDAWYQFPIFFPIHDALTLSEHLLGISLLAAPIQWLTGNPIAAYNLTALLSFPMCGLAMYALVWRLTKSAPAAFLAGLAYAFAPYRASQLPHIQVLVAWWAPLALLGLHGFLRAGPPPADAPPPARAADRGALSGAEPAAGTAPREEGEWTPPRDRLRWLALFAVCWLLQGASNGYFLVFFSVLAGLWVLWFLVARRRWHEAAAVGAAAALAFLPLAPIIHRYLQTHGELGLSRNLGEIASYSADIAAPLCAPAPLAFWSWLRIACAPEGELFPGIALIVLCLAGGLGLRSAGSRGAAENGPAAPPLRGRASARRLPSWRPWRSPGVSRAGIQAVRQLAGAIAILYLGVAASVIAFGPWRLDLGWLRASVSSPDKPLSVAAALVLIVFLLSGWWRDTVRRGSAAAFYLGAAGLCWVLSWGPFPRLFGADALYQAPFAWLLLIPGVGGLRAPARFWMMTVLCLIVFMGIAVARLLRERGRRTRTLFVVLAGAGLLMDGWMTIPAAAMPGAIAAPGALRGAVVIEFPPGQLPEDIGAVYGAVTGGWRSVNGYSGYEPAYYEAVRTLAASYDEVMLAPFLARSDVHVLVRADDERGRALIERQEGVEVVSRGGSRVHYRIPRTAGALERRRDATGWEGAAERPSGERIPIEGIQASCSPEGVAFAADGDHETHWVCGDQAADHELVADLGSVRTISTIVHALGTLGAYFPRELVVDTSYDGISWERAWAGSPAAAVLSAAMDAPRLTRAVMPFTPRAARYVRLRQVGRHEFYYWSIAELEVWTGT